jgi:hypothetical protein
MSANPDRPHEAPRQPPTSGVRTEHELRLLLRRALERNTALERAAREATNFAYGPRDLADLRKLRSVLSSTGFHDPNPKRPARDDDDGPATPADG